MSRFSAPVRTLTTILAATLATTTLSSCGDEDGKGRTTVSGTRWEDVVLDQDLGCGFGFAATDHTEHFRLTVHHTGEQRLDRVVRLPDPAWEAELQTGRNLAANWCSDVVLDPQAEVARTWRLVGGTLTFQGDLPALRTPRSPREVHATLVGAVGEDANGERVELGDVTLRNAHWGLFAG